MDYIKSDIIKLGLWSYDMKCDVHVYCDIYISAS